MINRLKFTMVIINFIFCSFILCGCWDYGEINNLSIVAGIAIDKNIEFNKYIITVETVNPSAPSSQQGGGNTSTASAFYEAEGDTIQDAIKNLSHFVSKNIYISHSQILIISKNIAANEIMSVIDWIARDIKPRLDMWFLVSRNETAKEVLVNTSSSNKINSFEISNIIQNSDTISKIPKIHLRDFMEQLTTEGLSPIVPSISVSVNKGKTVPEIKGSAVVLKGKLVNFLDEKDTGNVLWIKNKLKNRTLILNKAAGSDTNVSLKIYDNKTKLKPMYEKGNLTMRIDIKSDVAIEELSGKDNLLTEESMNLIKKEAEEKIKKELQSTVKKVQNEYNADILGFGSVIRKNMPKIWKQLSPNWYKSFSSLNVDINVKVSIGSIELTSKPIKVGD